jgi:hypothetical protein
MKEQKQNQIAELQDEEEELEVYDYECPHEYEHVDHLETVADEYRKELYCCMFCNKEKVVKNYFGVRD